MREKKRRNKEAVKIQISKTKFLDDSPEDKSFFLQDGTKIKNLEELRDELRFMKPEVFSNYVSKEKNDFANWIRDVISDVELADRVLKTKNRKKMFNIVNSRLIYLRIKAEKGEINTLEEIEKKLKELESEIEREDEQSIENLEKEGIELKKMKPQKPLRLLLGEENVKVEKAEEKGKMGRNLFRRRINEKEAVIAKTENKKKKLNVSAQKTKSDLKRLDRKIKITMSLLFILGLTVGYLIGKLV